MISSPETSKRNRWSWWAAASMGLSTWSEVKGTHLRTASSRDIEQHIKIKFLHLKIPCISIVGFHCGALSAMLYSD